MEKFYGKELQSWTKKPLKKGEGVRYYDGKGGSFELNQGYKNPKDDIHGSPYSKMKKDDLIEFLSSTIEEDAIISRIYNLFHNEWNYSLDELNEIINFGVKNGDLVIENVKDPAIQYDTIDWQLDNVYQEILMVDIYKYMPLLFNENPQVPNEYEKFISE